MSYDLNDFKLMCSPREAEKARQAARAQLHLVHINHWHPPGQKQQRRMRYWQRVQEKWEKKIGARVHITPGRPRGKRALVYASFLRRRAASVAAAVLQEFEAITKLPSE